MLEVSVRDYVMIITSVILYSIPQTIRQKMFALPANRAEY
jgi:hypothetical protein